MRNIFLILRFFLLLIFVLSCNPGAEEPPKENPLIFFLNIPVINGNYWEGVAALEECEYLPLEGSTIVNCLLLSEVERNIESSNPANLSLSLSLFSGQIEGRLFAIIPHFNLSANQFTFAVDATSTAQSGGGNYMLQLKQKSVSPESVSDGLQVTLKDFSAEELPEKISGYLVFELIQVGHPDISTLTYNFILNKKL